jgi:hypothetical protein
MEEFIFLGLLCIPLILRIDFYYQLSKLIKSNSNYSAQLNPKIIYLPLIPVFGIYFLFKIAKKVDVILDSIYGDHQVTRYKDIYQLLAVSVVLLLLMTILIATNNTGNPLVLILGMVVSTFRFILGTILYYQVDKAKKISK